MTISVNNRWLPINFAVAPTGVTVKWLDFGMDYLKEPFFHQTIKRIRATIPSPEERVTSMLELTEIADTYPSVDPAGIIFHVSRCGSTHLANLLKLGNQCAVLSEAAPIGILFEPQLFAGSSLSIEDQTAIRSILLKSVVRIYAGTLGRSLVLKCHAASVLRIEKFRAVWPLVPFIVMIRNPIEVMISNLDGPAGWMRGINHGNRKANIFDLKNSQIQSLSMEQYCAFGLGQFLRSALQKADSNSWVLDYEHLDENSAFRVAELFKIALPPKNSVQLERVFNSYSKDLSGSKLFVDDRERKQNDASPSIKRLALEFAQQPYEALRRAENQQFSKI